MRRWKTSERCGSSRLTSPATSAAAATPSWWRCWAEKCVGMDVNSMKPAGQSVPPGLGHPGSRAADRRRLRCGARLFDGGRHHLRCAGDGAVGGKARGENHPAPQRPSQRDGRDGAVRRGSGLCQPRMRRASGHPAGDEACRGGKGHPAKSRRQGHPGQQPHLLRHLLRPQRNRGAGAPPRHAVPGG